MSGKPRRENKNTNSPLAAELQHFRRQRGWSQTDVAELLRSASGSYTVSRHEVSRWERGLRIPSDYWLGWLAVVLNARLGGLAAVQARARAEQELVRLGRAGLSIDATLTHKVPGWHNVINMFAESRQPQAIEASAVGPSLSDLTDAYEERGFTFQEDRRQHAARVLGREVMTSHELSSADIRTLLDDLRPVSTYADIIEAEVLPQDRTNRHEPTGVRVEVSHSEDGYARMPGERPDRPTNRARLYR